MKKLIVLLLLCTPVYANVEFCNCETCIDYGEEQVQSIETTRTPSYGIKIRLKNGHVQFMEGCNQREAFDMLWQGYSSLEEYYNWPDGYIHKVILQQDKAGLGVHGR